jgi:hypothetical protein
MLEESDGSRTEYYGLCQNAEAHTTEGYHRADTILQKTEKRRRKEVARWNALKSAVDLFAIWSLAGLTVDG